LAAQALDLFEIARLWRMYPACAHDGLCDIGRNVLCPKTFDKRRKRARVMLGNTLGAIDQRISAVAFAVEVQAGHTGAISMQAVVRVLATDDDFFVDTAHVVPVTTRKLQGHINRI